MGKSAGRDRYDRNWHARAMLAAYLGAAAED
jgi:hypothetical protein